MPQQQQEWIDSLADDIKPKNHEAAENYGRDQHYAAVIAEKGKPFFVLSPAVLQQNIDALRTRLQGDLTASETGVQTVRACEVKISRARFPWVDATVEHHGETITLDYAKTPTAPRPATGAQDLHLRLPRRTRRHPVRNRRLRRRTRRVQRTGSPRSPHLRNPLHPIGRAEQARYRSYSTLCRSLHQQASGRPAEISTAALHLAVPSA